MSWGESLPSATGGRWATKSLHWDGTEDSLDTGKELKLNIDRGVFMYTFLGGWYKAFGIEGDSLPALCTSLFGNLAGGELLLEDENGKVILAISGCTCIFSTESNCACLSRLQIQ
jgi:hypothetical protein